jgi:hypothetical protein
VDVLRHQNIQYLLRITISIPSFFEKMGITRPETLVQEALAPEKMAEAQHTAMGTRRPAHDPHAQPSPSKTRLKQTLSMRIARALSKKRKHHARADQ